MSDDFEQGRFLEFERVKDWWGANLPIIRGQHNFDVLHYDYYRDRETAFEGFSAQELHIPRRIHLARLGDALRFSRQSAMGALSAKQFLTIDRPVRKAG